MEVIDKDVEARLRAEADHCYRWSNDAGAVYTVHSHPFGKILYVAEGSITFTPEGKPPIVIGPGDRLELAPGIRHGAVVGSNGVVCWEGQARII